jgi:PTH1 family peptidyl-tRNA hydrolase|tara:strand:- start:5062 stop:5628 length:567 start_codon:yes stop_codon:yes gene_type:complete
MYRLCIVGLGNPGKKYNGTRHNIGKDWLIKISNQFFTKFNTKTKFEAEIGESHNNELLWSIPTNYMNDSGKTIFKILKSTNLKSDMLLIIHDDLDLKLGELRIKKGGGHGGHNGLRDIINKTGQDNFMRLRIGISHPGNKNDVTNWVLTKFSPDEKKIISSSYSKFEETIELICNNKIEEAQKILHTR